ncbi:hypothetical protein OYT1_ch2154 [Ferriphaselus amnicola]|uniref:Uncharacterized protein n=1 Tax=Ferriphaselus amnicola TaxID=1188319 RepID=A0A2Z6GED5_9PROT|nr:hypothetical protein OYT1_ch2154 [Ferriphaselus amnicola]
MSILSSIITVIGVAAVIGIAVAALTAQMRK